MPTTITQHPNVRFTSDGTPEGTNIEVLGNDSTWALVQGCVAAKLHPENGDEPRYLELTILGPLVDIDSARWIDLITIEKKG